MGVASSNATWNPKPTPGEIPFSRMARLWSRDIPNAKLRHRHRMQPDCCRMSCTSPVSVWLLPPATGWTGKPCSGPLTLGTSYSHRPATSCLKHTPADPIWRAFRCRTGDPISDHTGQRNLGAYSVLRTTEPSHSRTVTPSNAEVRHSHWKRAPAANPALAFQQNHRRSQSSWLLTRPTG